jgi:predicted Holliday junction resolvase-like endonuclease
MDLAGGALVAAIVAAALGWIVAWYALGRMRFERAERERVEHAKRSLSVRYGQTSEQLAPWMRGWPFASTEGFRFLGKPIDGVHFEEDAVYFVEIKSADARLSKPQRAVRDAVEAGRVGWVEFYVNEEKPARVVRPWEH